MAPFGVTIAKVISMLYHWDQSESDSVTRNLPLILQRLLKRKKRKKRNKFFNNLNHLPSMLKNKTKVLNTKSWLIASKTTSTKESSFWQELAWVSHLEFLISVLQAQDFTANSPNTISHTLRPYLNWVSTSRIQNHSWESPKSFYPVNTSRL